MKDKKTISEIAQNVVRSRCAAVNYIKKKIKSGTFGHIGRPEKLTLRAVRAIVNVFKTPGRAARKATIPTGVNASLRKVQRAIATHDLMENCHLKKRAKLEPRHVKLRFEWN